MDGCRAAFNVQFASIHALNRWTWMILLGGLMSSTSWGQSVWSNPFESTLRTHEKKAWTFSVGTSQLHGMPTQVNSTWVRNSGTAETPILDTLHVGIWQTKPRPGWRLGLGHLWMLEDVIWADRVTASAHLSQSKTGESFLGIVKGVGEDTTVAMVDELLQADASATSIELDLQAMGAMATGPEGFVEWRAGVRSAFHMLRSDLIPIPNMYEPAELPRWNVALTMGVGAGLKVYRGRMLRLTVDVDVIQLAQAPTPEILRPVESDVRGLDWLQSGYRPWRLTLHHDLYKRKPEQGCAAPTRSEASKTLFDPKMKGIGKAKSKGLGKALKSRER